MGRHLPQFAWENRRSPDRGPAPAPECGFCGKGLAIDAERGLKELTENQERTRHNLDALSDAQSDFYRQLVARLAEEVKQTDARQQAINELRAGLRAAEKAFADYLQGLEL